MFKNIRKFLIFQLTVNISAVLICFIGPLLGQNIILTVIQLLLINLVMDTLAAISFGSEPAISEYMREKPVPREEGIVTKQMFVQILISAAYITFICLGILFVNPISGLFGDASTTYLKSALFATFMMAITFNGFNARTTSINVFKGIGKNKSFIGVTVAILIIQFVFITFGGAFLSVTPLSAGSWLICIVLAIIVIPVDMLRKLLLKDRI